MTAFVLALRKKTALFIAALLLTVLIGGGFAAPAAQAQPAASAAVSAKKAAAVSELATPKRFDLATKSAQWRANFGKQLAVSLRSRNARIREQTMMNIIQLAAGHDDKRDFYPAVSGLIRVYERDRNEGYRLMALTALHAIDHAPSMEYLSNRVAAQWEPSKRVHRHALVILNDHNRKRKEAGK